MPSLVFVVPVHGRLPLAQICLRQLRRTCDALRQEGVLASAIVIVDKENFAELRATIGKLKFGFVRRDNRYLSQRFNDGIQAATDPRWNPCPADYVVPFGSDDWADHRIFLDLPAQDTVVGFKSMSFVREDGLEIQTTYLNYLGGSGIRIIPRGLLAQVGYRPGDEDRKRGCDTSILRNLRVQVGDRMHIEHRHLHDRQIVDWKTPQVQLNPYTEVTRLYPSTGSADPFTELAGIYPEAALEEMRGYYGLVQVAA